MTFTIGLTGGIGSGKSTVAGIFQELGVPVFDTDVIARELVEPGKPALKEIIKTFGTSILDKSGNLDRQALKEKVFHSDEARDRLEKILHPEIREQLLSYIASCSAAYCIAVIPLLIEKDWQDTVDRVLVVDTSEESQIARTISRDSVSRKMIQHIIDTQVDRITRLANADDVIDNTGSRSELVNHVSKLHEKYLHLSGDNE